MTRIKMTAIGAAVLLAVGFGELFAAEMQTCYTVQEIDELRVAVDNRYLWGDANGSTHAGWCRSYSEGEKAKVVEEQVRTYMLAGIKAKQLKEADKLKK